MRRWHEDIAIMARRARQALDGQPTDPGRYRKRHPRDCGRSRCGLCHPSKRWPTGPTRSEARRAAVDTETAYGQ